MGKEPATSAVTECDLYNNQGVMDESPKPIGTLSPLGSASAEELYFRLYLRLNLLILSLQVKSLCHSLHSKWVPQQRRKSSCISICVHGTQ
jgi:hypothetical protein